MDRRDPENRPPERIFREEEGLSSEAKREIWRHAARILLGNGWGCGGPRLKGYAIYNVEREERETGMDTNLFGEKAPPIDRQGRCSHVNVTYKLECHTQIRVRSRYEPGEDAVEEIERKTTWSGNVSGRCEDCGKDLWYTASNMPKFIKRRLVRWDGLDAVEGRRIVER